MLSSALGSLYALFLQKKSMKYGMCRLKIKAVNFLKVIIHIYHMKLLILSIYQEKCKHVNKVLYAKCSQQLYSY